MSTVRDEWRSAPREPGDPLAPGYVVLEHLHRGEVLDVYDVWSEERSCRCIGKVLRPDASESRAARRGLLREGRLLLRLTHPHIVRAYAVLADPTPVVILETLPGETLAQFVSRIGPLPDRELAYLGLHVCSALAYLHRQQTLHLDLTPANIVASQGLAKVIDLSLSRRPGRSRGGLGTPGFRAPEQATGGMLSSATDVFGLAAVLTFATNGQPPIEEDDVTASVIDKAMARPRWDERVPGAVRATLGACLAGEPERRPDLAELTTCLATLIDEAEHPAARIEA